jgi:hypothetical protein
MNRHLSIYQPQGVSLVSMMTFETPAERHSSGSGEKSPKRKAAASVSRQQQQAEAEVRYKAAFGGYDRTATELGETIGITRDGVRRQLRKYIAVRKVRLLGIRNNERTYYWNS